MPTLGEQVEELLAQHQDMSDIRKGMESAFGLSTKELSEKYWNTPIDQLRAARKQSLAVVPNYLSEGTQNAPQATPVTTSVLPKVPLKPTLEQQLGPGGIPVAGGAAAHPLTGDDTPVGLPVADNALTRDTALPRVKHDRVQPTLEGGIFNPKDELLHHIMPAIKEAGNMTSVEVPRTRGRGGPMTGQGGEVSPEEYRTHPAHHVSDAYKAAKEDLDERGRNNPIWNTITDAGDFVLAPLQLAAEIVLPKEVHGDNTLEAQGHALGGAIAGGLVGGTAAQLDNPAAMLYGRPLSSAAAIAPVLGAVVKGAPALAKGIGKLPFAPNGSEAALLRDVDLATPASKVTRSLGNAFTEQRALSNYGPTLGPKSERIPGTPLDMKAMDAARKQMAADIAKAQKYAADDGQAITRATDTTELELRDRAMNPPHGKSFKAAQDELTGQIKDLWDKHNEIKKVLDDRLKGKEAAATAAYDAAIKPLEAAVTPDRYNLKAGAGLGDQTVELASKVSEWIGKYVKKPAVRFIADSLHTGDPVVTSLVESIIRDPEAAASEMKSLGRRIGKEVEVADAPAPHTDADIANARTVLRTNWEDDIRSKFRNPNGAEADAAVEAAQYNALSVQKHNQSAIATVDKLAEQGIKATPKLKAGEPWLDSGPTRDINMSLLDGEGTMEVAKHHLPEDLLVGTARDLSLENFAAKNPKIMELSGRIAARMGLDPAETAKVGKLVLSALDRESLYSLHDSAVMDKVIERIRDKWASGGERTPLTTDGLKVLLKPYLDVGINGIDHMPEIGVGTGFLGIPDIIRDVTMGLKPEARSNIVRSVVNKLADIARKDGIAKNLLAESTRLAPEEFTGAVTESMRANEGTLNKQLVDLITDKFKVAPSEVTAGVTPESRSYAISVADEVARGQHPPLVLPKGVSVNDAQKAFRSVALVAKDIATETYAPGLAKAAEKMSTYFDNFVDPSAHVDGHRAGHVHPDLAQSIKWENLANEGINDPATLWFNRQIKSNLTTRSPHSAINNFVSNTALQSTRRGDPLIFAKAADTARKYEQFMGGFRPLEKVAKLTAEDNRIFRAVETTGIIDTDAIAKDVGLMKAGNKLNPLRMAEKLYRTLGDNSFKLEETVHNFKTLDGYLGKLAEGESITASATPRTKATITKTANGYKVEIPGFPTKELAAGSEQLDNLLAKIASKPAQDIFFDYGETGIFAKWLKQAPILGVASPFYTWSYKALDIPLLKRGLASRAIELPFGVQTNSSAVALEQLASAAVISARKGAFLTAARNDLLQHENSQLGEVARRQPRELRMFWATQLADPTYIGGYDLGKFNWLAPSKKLFGLMTGIPYDVFAKPNLVKDYNKQDFSGYDKALAARKGGGEDYETPEGKLSTGDWAGRLGDTTARQLRFNQLMQKSDTGQLYSAKDALDLVGLSGGPILDVINWLSSADDQGKTLSLQQAVQKLAGSLASGGVRDLANVATGGIEAATGYHVPGSPHHNEKDTTVQEDFLRYAIRQITGMGYNVKNLVETADPKKPFSYYHGMQSEWLNALGVYNLRKAAEQNLAVAEHDKNQHAIDQNKRKLEASYMLENIVKGEISRMYGTFMETAEALGLKPPKWKDTPSPVSTTLKSVEEQMRKLPSEDDIPEPVAPTTPAPVPTAPGGPAEEASNEPPQLANAKSLLGKITYDLGATKEHVTDCSGFVAKTLGLPMGHWTTDGIIHDATTKQRKFESIPFSEVQPGDFVVYGSNSNREEGRRHGHIAMVVDPKARTLIDNTESRGGVHIHRDTVGFWEPHKDRKQYAVRYIGPTPKSIVAPE